jgi:hypothetical protein
VPPGLEVRFGRVTAVGQKAFAATSLVGAVPAGILAYFIVMDGFLKNVSNMGGLMMFLVGATLGASLFVVVIPFGILLAGGSKKKKAAAAKPAKSEDESEEASSAAVMADESEDDILETSGEAMVVDSDAEVSGEMVSSGEIAVEDDELDATTAFGAPVDADSDVFAEDAVVEDELEDNLATLDEIEDEVILEDEDDDEPKNKKKRH